MRAWLLLAAAAAAAAAAGIEQIEHIVIFMQENRAFDEYYGTRWGVRGFGDHAAPLLPSGREAWFQPLSATNDSMYQLPYHIDMQRTSASCMDAPTMNYPTDICMWNQGHNSAWNLCRAPGYGMSYFNRSDLPYYYALTDGFTIGDQYFQSTFTETNPNRLHLFSGSNGLSAGHEPVLNNFEPIPGFEWETLGETLEKNNISWRVYMEQDNFDDNAFAWFKTFQNAVPGDALYDKGLFRSDDLVAEFRQDVESGKLPQVSYLVAPTHKSEHATNHPADGEDLSARLIQVLQDNPAMHAKTAFILNYDEGGQFYDHHWSPTPPVDDEDGMSTVTTKGEVTMVGLPIGMGFRVPLVLVSPWTRGPHTCSHVLDHTSVVQFVEQRFGVHSPNISPWRRALAGDLTECFDFDHPDYSWPVLPNTTGYVNASEYQCEHFPAPVVPTQQSLPVPEPGTRLARPLAYEFHAALAATATQTTLTLNNTGLAAGAFQLHNYGSLGDRVRKYTVEAGKQLQHSFADSGALRNYSLHGPNGFVRQFVVAEGQGATVAIDYDKRPGHQALLVTLTADPHAATSFTMDDPTYRANAESSVTVPAGATKQLTWALPEHQWYDLRVQAGSSMWRAKGHLENGQVTSTDPALQHQRPGPCSHPPTPENYRHIPRLNKEQKDSWFFDAAHPSDF